MMTGSSKINNLTGYQGQLSNSNAVLKSEPETAREVDTGDDVSLSRKAKELQSVYRKKETDLEQNYTSKSQKLEREYRQEKVSLHKEFQQKKQSLNVNVYA